MGIYNYNKEPLVQPTSLYGATWMQIGDSLTDGSSGSGSGGNDVGFGYAIAKKYGCKFVNNGTSGASWTIRNADYDAQCGVTRVNELLEMKTKPDILTIALGTNDRENGESTDTKDTTTTLYGAVRYCLYTLKTNLPTLRLGVIIPPNRGTTNGNVDSNQKTRNKIIKEVCKEFSVPYCDMMEESGITPEMLGDGLHLTNTEVIVENMPVCRWFYMRKLESFLLTL